MFILFGTRERKNRRSTGNILSGGCPDPDCNGDLAEYYIRNWFTLYELPIFPIEVTDCIYRCNTCSREYSKDIRDHYYYSMREKKRSGRA